MYRKNFIIGFILFMFIILLSPSFCHALTFTEWRENLETVAKTIEDKNYYYYENIGSLGADYYSDLEKQDSLVDANYFLWLSTKEGKKWFKKWPYYSKDASYPDKKGCKVYYYTSGNGCSKSKYNKYVENRRIDNKYCNKCMFVSCNNKKNKSKSEKYCKYYYNHRKVDAKFKIYQSKVKISNNENVNNRGMVCHNYVKFALQRLGLYSGDSFSIKDHEVSDATCDFIKKSGKLEIIVPEDIDPDSVNCKENVIYDKRLNRDSETGKRPTLDYLASKGVKGVVQRGDIISQAKGSGSGHHSFIYIGRSIVKNSDGSSTTKLTLYGISSIYGIRRNFYEYLLNDNYEGLRFLTKLGIQDHGEDTHNSHSNPGVGAIIRIKDLEVRGYY